MKGCRGQDPNQGPPDYEADLLTAGRPQRYAIFIPKEKAIVNMTENGTYNTIRTNLFNKN